MIYAKLIEPWNEPTEGSRYLNINGVMIEAFSYEGVEFPTINQIYAVELSMMISEDGEAFSELNDFYAEKSITLVGGLGSRWQYTLCGLVVGDCLDVGNGILIKDELFQQYTYLNGKYIKINVLRLDVEFI
jgi:hypothetical protein